MIVASSVFSVRAEETLIVETFESHSEVIGFCIQRIAGVGEFIFPGDGIYFGDIDVESAHSHMTVAAEVKVAVRAEGREHLIAWCVDRFAQVLYAAQSGRSDAHSPDVESAFSARHV